MTALETAIERWKAEGVCLDRPSEPSLVAAKLSALGRRYSRDVISLYAATGGMSNGESDSHLFSLWGIEKIVSETAQSGRPHILFADFSINAHLYCLKYKNEEESSVVIDYFNGEEPESVAGSIQEFFEIFNSDAAKLRIFE
jgi:hypothetical protein